MNRSGFQPIDKIHLAFHAYHVAAHDHNQSVESYHFCAGGNDGVFQCLIYDSAEKDAKLIGIEYLIPEEVFATLDDEEKRLWHSHKFEVATGLLLPLHPDGQHTAERSGGLLAAKADVEKQQMQMIYKMYGKIIHTWHPPSQKLPLGAPTLMVSMSQDDSERICMVHGKVDKGSEVVQRRDARHGFDTQEARKRRMSYLDLDYKTLDGADAWKDGKSRQFVSKPSQTKLTDGTTTGVDG